MHKKHLKGAAERDLKPGYPEKAPKTQTKKTRGTGAATKGNKHSKNSQ
jgi:hypothetical protein